MAPHNLQYAAIVRVALVSDTHLSRDADGTGTLHRRRLNEVIAAANGSSVGLVLFAGDLTDRAAPEDVEIALEQMRRFNAPVCFVAGNHDVGDKLSVGGSNPITEASLNAYEARIGPAFFVERFKGLRVIGVTASLFGSNLPRENQQWAFLDDQLRTSTPETTVLLTHYPPFVHTRNEPPDQWNIDPVQRNRLMTLLQRGRVCAILSGHTHHPLTLQHNGILLAPSPAISFGLPWGDQAQGWMLLTISQPHEVNIAMRAI